MLKFALAATLSLTATFANAEMIKVASPYSVDESLNRLTSAVEGAGAKVFARVEHAKGAAMINEELAPMALLIFGKPEVGTPAMQVNPLAGVALPARVLAYQDADGKVWLAYGAPDALKARHSVSGRDDVFNKMTAALDKLTSAAVKAE